MPMAQNQDLGLNSRARKKRSLMAIDIPSGGSRWPPFEAKKRNKENNQTIRKKRKKKQVLALNFQIQNVQQTNKLASWKPDSFNIMVLQLQLTHHSFFPRWLLLYSGLWSGKMSKRVGVFPFTPAFVWEMHHFFEVRIRFALTQLDIITHSPIKGAIMIAFSKMQFP